MAPEALVLAHQLGRALTERLAGMVPPGIRMVPLPPAHAYEVPAEAKILLAVPPRGGVTVPGERPDGWPRGLVWAHTISAGIDEYPKWLLEVPQVTCGRGTNSSTIAEFVLASMLAFEKRFPRSWIRSAEAWDMVELGTLRGKTLGLLGFGSIGRTVAALAAPFGMRILAHRRGGADPDAAGVAFADLETVLAEADHLVVALPLTDATQRLLDRNNLGRAKRGMHLVNISRGAIVDQDALLEALDSGRVGGASLDVTEPEPLPAGHPLYAHPQVRLSPHLSWSGGAAFNFLDLFVENLKRFVDGSPLLHRVEPARGY